VCVLAVVQQPNVASSQPVAITASDEDRCNHPGVLDAAATAATVDISTAAVSVGLFV